MHFDSTISLGNILTIVGFVAAFWVAANGIYTRIDRRIVAFETLLEQHALTLVQHASKMEKQDDILLRLVGDMQRLIGRVEGSQQNIDRAETVARELIALAAVTAKDLIQKVATATAVPQRS